MSDLISRSALIEILEDYENDDWNKNISAMLPSVVDDCIDFIENMPTAYSVDKVVEELKELKMRYFLTIANTGDEKSDFAYENVGNALDKAIEIVKQGGDVTETKTIRDKATEWNNHSSKKVPYEFIDFVEGKREIAKDDDVCKWLEDAYGRWHTQCNILADNSPLEYTYCPYCSKKIKVVE